MILKELYINADIRCALHSGLNIILARNYVSKSGDSKKKKTSDTNGVGKSKIVQAIKHVLRGDSSGAFNSEFFSERKFWGQLHIGSGNSDSLVLIRPLWFPLGDQAFLVYHGTLDEHLVILEKRGIALSELTSIQAIEAAFSDLEGYLTFTQEEYSQFLSRIEKIDYSEAKLTFSSLLDYIIRDEKKGFTEPISLANRQEWVQYRAIQYLFGLPAHIEDKARKLTDRISELTGEAKGARKELDAKGIKTVDKIENLRTGLIKQLDNIKNQIAAVQVSEALEDVKVQYSEKRRELTDVNRTIVQKEAHIEGYQKNVEELKTRAKALSELLKAKEFYEELLQFFPEQIDANLKEYNEFFSALQVDRKEYYSELIKDLRHELKVLNNKKEELERAVDDLSARFKTEQIVADIATLTSREAKAQAELDDLDRLRGVLAECEKMDEEVVTLEKSRDDIIESGKEEEKEGREKRKAMIQLFHSLLTDIFKTTDGILEFEFNSNKSSSIVGRTEIVCTIPSQDSHGRTYSRINLFDFVWFLRERSDDEFNPKFLIHDGSYAKISKEVKREMLRSIIERIRGEKQYIITVNEGELEDLESYSKYFCITLDGGSVNGKFFNEQFD